ncbi:MAG TPA: hypothetical protein VFM28_11135 [Nitrososphaeraceae archaeon]|nr:hypothetical protein [Nitrososphaeraceae archaeon]
MISVGGNPLSCSTDACSGETVGSFLFYHLKDNYPKTISLPHG